MKCNKTNQKAQYWKQKYFTLLKQYNRNCKNNSNYNNCIDSSFYDRKKGEKTLNYYNRVIPR